MFLSNILVFFGVIMGFKNSVVVLVVVVEGVAVGDVVVRVWHWWVWEQCS